MTYRRVKIPAGYEDWGRVRMPLPSYIVLTDRTTGAQKVLSHDAGVTTIQLDDLNTRTHTDRVEYAAYDEPRPASDDDYRLILDNGTLSFEYDPLPQGIGAKSQPPLYTRRSHQRSALLIDIDSDGEVATTEEDF